MLAYLFVLIAVAVRFIPHPFSFTPVAASLLFFGARKPSRDAWFPVLLLIGSDLVLTRALYRYPIRPDQLIIWTWYGATALMGGMLREKARPRRILGASLTAAVTFFLSSNLGVWLGWTLYPMTLSGLAQCLAMGLPFFRNELISDVIFTALLFSLPAGQQLSSLLEMASGAPTQPQV